MSIISICVLAVTAVVIIIMLRPKNGETALMLGIACGVVILLSVIKSASAVFSAFNTITSAAQINTAYIAILLKVIGICLITEFAVSTCKDAGSQALAGNVALAGKIMVTVTALPLYTDILNTVMSVLG